MTSKKEIKGTKVKIMLYEIDRALILTLAELEIKSMEFKTMRINDIVQKMKYSDKNANKMLFYDALIIRDLIRKNIESTVSLNEWPGLVNESIPRAEKEDKYKKELMERFNNAIAKNENGEAT